jgi:hypothetical protein
MVLFNKIKPTGVSEDYITNIRNGNIGEKLMKYVKDSVPILHQN